MQHGCPNESYIRQWASTVAESGSDRPLTPPENDEQICQHTSHQKQPPFYIPRIPLPISPQFSLNHFQDGKRDQSAYSDQVPNDDDEDDEDLMPSDSMSQVAHPDLSRVREPVPATTSSLLSVATAGYETPKYYIDKLKCAYVFPAPEQYPIMVSRHFTRDAYEKGQIRGKERFDIAIKRLKEFYKLLRSSGYKELTLHGSLEYILIRFINTSSSPEPLDDDYAYALQNPEEWDRIPSSITHHLDLSFPKVDIVVAARPSSLPQYSGSDFPPGNPPSANLPHPLSHEAMDRILRDPDTRERAPLKSTDSRSNTLHDLFVIEIKIDGQWQKATGQADQVLERSIPMEVARVQVVNASFVQLASMIELMANVPLPTDRAIGPRPFVLSMTVCGSEWTVEYTTRGLDPNDATFFATIAQGNWSKDPGYFLYAIDEVLRQSLPNLHDKAARMQKLLSETDPARQGPLVPLEPREYARSRSHNDTGAGQADNVDAPVNNAKPRPKILSRPSQLSQSHWAEDGLDPSGSREDLIDESSQQVSAADEELVPKLKRKRFDEPMP